jgi:hypothetical protein
MATTLYYIVVNAGDTAPTAAQVVAGVSYTGGTVLDAGSVAYTSAGTYDADSAPVTGASASTAYDQWWVAYDGVTYGTPVSGEITTAGASLDLDPAALALAGAISVSGSAPVDGTTGISWEFTGGTSGGATITMLAASFEPDGADTVTVLSAHSSSASQIPAGATNYMGVSGARAFVGSVANAGLVLPLGGVWRGLHVVNPDGNTTTGTVDIDSYINAGGNQAKTTAWRTRQTPIR